VVRSAQARSLAFALARSLALATLLTSAAVGCLGATAGNDAPARVEPDAAPKDAATGVFVDRATACTRFVDALDAKARALGCALSPTPSCPTILTDLESRGGFGGRCVRYDEGTIASCEALVGSYKSCEDFSSKSCSFVVTEDKSGASCGGGDAGTDASDGGTDATPG
jgi:hypothetical protein